MTTALKPRPFVQVTATARKRRRSEKTDARIRLEAADGLLIQCPRQWRGDMGNGLRYVVTAALRSDGACYVVRASDGYKLAEGAA